MTSPPPSDSPACCLELRHVAKKYPGSQIFDDLNLRIEPGQIIAVLGANGAGKTTLLRLLAGLLSPDQGEIYVTDELLHFDRLDLRRKIYFLPDFPPLIGHQTILESIAMVLHLWQKDRPGVEQEVAGWIEDFSMSKLCRAPIGSFSRGQLYKAAVLGLLAVDPDIWLVDEPFASGMDPQGILGFKRHAREAVARGKTILYSTQIIEIAEEFCDQLLILDEHGVRAFDRPENLRQNGSLESLFRSLQGTP